MKKSLFWQIPLAALAYFLMIILGAASGAIHPACFAYAGTVLPLLFAFAYLFVAAKMQCFGAAVVLNGVSLLILLIGGEGNPALIIMLILVIPVAILAMRLAEKVMKKSSDSLSLF